MRKSDPDIARVPKSRCLQCRGTMNALGTAVRDLAADPHPGDVAICMRCGAVMKLDGKLRLRGMSDQEMDELVADRAWMDEIARMVRSVHLVRHSRG